MAYSPAISGRRNHHHQLHLLEVTVLSSQDLPYLAASRPTYAVAWIRSSDRVSTTLSRSGGGGPYHAWNEKLVFRVGDTFLRSETSSITIHLYAKRRKLAGFLRRRDSLLGTARVLVSTVNPSTSTTFVALQVRRPKTLKPHGILNIGITLILGRSTLPLDPNAPAAFVYRDFSRNGEMRGSRAVAGQSSRRGEREREILEWKLRKWRTDLSPIQDGSEAGSSPSLVGEYKRDEAFQSLEEEGTSGVVTSRRSLGEEKVHPTMSPSIEAQVLPPTRRHRRGVMLCCFRGRE